MTPAANPPDEERLLAVCRAYALEPTETNLDTFARILSRDYEFDDHALGAENQYLFARLLMDNGAMRPAAGQTETAPTLVLERHYFYPILAPEVKLSHNVRVVNSGAQTIPSTAQGGPELAARWLVKNTGAPAAPVSDATPLPVAMAPGRGLTLPLWLETPAEPGEYSLELTASGSPFAQIPIWIVEGVAPIYQIFKPVVEDPLPDYDEDHREGIRMIERALQDFGARTGIELGGGTTPMTTNLPCDVVSTDIDVQSLQVGRFVFRIRGHHNVRFLCCDAHRLPYRDASFDFAAIFSALHHFTDPVAVLREAARVVKPDGFLAVMCEPCGHFRKAPDAEMQKALEDGINEQRFSLAEYQEMFYEAGLEARRAKINADSLKVILVYARALREQRSIFDGLQQWLSRLSE